MHGIRSHAVTECTGDTVRLQLSTDGDLRETLFYAFAKANVALLESRPRMASLEDVFLDLTDDDDTVAAQAAALLHPEDAAPAAEPADDQAAAFTVPEEKEAPSDESNL